MMAQTTISGNMDPIKILFRVWIGKTNFSIFQCGGVQFVASDLALNPRLARSMFWGLVAANL